MPQVRALLLQRPPSALDPQHPAPALHSRRHQKARVPLAPVHPPHPTPRTQLRQRPSGHPHVPKPDVLVVRPGRHEVLPVPVGSHAAHPRPVGAPVDPPPAGGLRLDLDRGPAAPALPAVPRLEEGVVRARVHQIRVRRVEANRPGLQVVGLPLECHSKVRGARVAAQQVDPTVRGGGRKLGGRGVNPLWRRGNVNAQAKDTLEALRQRSGAKLALALDDEGVALGVGRPVGAIPATKAEGDLVDGDLAARLGDGEGSGVEVPPVEPLDLKDAAPCLHDIRATCDLRRSQGQFALVCLRLRLRAALALAGRHLEELQSPGPHLCRLLSCFGTLQLVQAHRYRSRPGVP